MSGATAVTETTPWAFLNVTVSPTRVGVGMSPSDAHCALAGTGSGEQARQGRGLAGQDGRKGKVLLSHCAPSARMMASLKAGMSSGFRDVMTGPSTTTGLST